jgi:hypothetical protein
MQKLMGVSVLLAFAATGASAGIISSATSGTNGNVAGFIGQSVTTPGTVTGWNNITFDFFSNGPGTTPAAFGTLFILTQKYTGTPAALSSGTTGFVASSTSIVSGVYQFNSTVTLAANTTYYFYENTALAVGAVTGSASGTTSYFASSSATAFSSTGVGTTNYQLSGTATPEPRMFGMVGLAGLAGVLVQFRRRKA